MKQKNNKAPANTQHPKYQIAQLLRNGYGEFGVKMGIKVLAQHCGVAREQTVKDWLKIEAGSARTITHFALPRVLSFFDLQEESQLFTTTHNELLNKHQQLELK